MAKAKNNEVTSWAYTQTRFPVEPEVAGKTLEAIRKRDGGLNPEIVVEDARPKNAPLHPAFEWDNATAGQQYRVIQARQMIRSVVCIRENTDTGKKVEEIRYVSIGNLEHKSKYTTTIEALSDEEMKHQVMKDARAQMLGIQRRCQRIEDMAESMELLRQSIDAIPIPETATV